MKLLLHFSVFTGVLPRPEGKLADKPLPIPMWRRHEKDAWVQKKALFGQNDYIGWFLELFEI